MIILFVRHADDIDNKITKLGKKQCEVMVDYEEEFAFAKIYSSPAKRCVDTAKPLSKKFNLDIEILDELNERDQLNNKTPQTKEEKMWYDNYMNPSYSCAKPEGCKEYLDRNFSAFNKIINNHIDKNENAIIVAHSGTFYILSAFINGYDKNKDLKWSRVGNCAKIYFEINKKV